MKKKMLALTCIVLTLFIVLSTVGCQKNDVPSNSINPNQTETVAKGPKTKLDIYHMVSWNASPNKNGEVIKWLNNYLNTELTITIDAAPNPPTFQTWLATGEWPGVIADRNNAFWRDTFASGGKLIDLTKYFNDPVNYPVAGGTAFIIRKDLREKYNIPEIKDLSGFEAYLEAVTTGEKGMAGFVGRGGAGGLDFDLAFGPDVLNIGSDMAVFAEIDPDIKPYKAANKLTSDSFKKRMEWLKKAYKNGWIPRDILTIRDENTLLASGKAAALCNDMWTVNSLGPIVRAYIPGGELETFTFRDYSMPMIRMTKVNNFACISSTSNNKERAMMFLDWMRASKENYELYMYGIKGKHWNPIGDNQYELPEGVDPAKKPYNPSPWWAKVMQFDRLDKLSEPGFLHIYNQVVDAKYTTPELINFSFDSEPVKTEWVQVGAAYAEIMGPIGQGINDSEADYLAAIKRFDELGMQKIIDEIQRQLDAWAAKNKK
jgi:putative aldouronate transport system substrate-binding protein